MSDAKAVAVARAAAPAPEEVAAGMPRASDADGEMTTDWSHEVQRWLQPEHWPQPAWSGVRLRRTGLHRYDSYVLHQCRVRYLELETDFRTVFGNWAYGMLGGEPVDVVTGQCCVGLLHSARRALEQPDPDMLSVAATLDLVERCMVWATPSYLLGARIPGLRRRIEQEVPADTCRSLEPLLSRLTLSTDGTAGRPSVPLHEMRSAIDEAIVVLNAAVTERQITSGLQLERLTILRDRGMMLLGALIALLPMFMPVATTTMARLTVPFVLRFVPLAASDAWLSGVAVAMFGASGGFLSGLLQARGATVTTAEYQDSVLRLELRPIVGATIAIVLFVLLSWGIVPGVAITSGGSYLLLAFLAGFSERYFLRLLELQPDEAQDAAERGMTESAPTSGVAGDAMARAAFLRRAGPAGGSGATGATGGGVSSAGGPGRGGPPQGPYGGGGGRAAGPRSGAPGVPLATALRRDARADVAEELDYAEDYESPGR